MRHLIFGLMVSTAAACGGSPPAENDAEQSVNRDDKAVQALRDEALARKNLERVPAQTAPSSGEVPQEILEATRQDLLAKVSSNATVNLQRAESVIWPDGSLGCPTPGVSYPKQPVPGFQVVYVVDGQQWDYRVQEGGYFRLCDGSVRSSRPYSQPTS